MSRIRVLCIKTSDSGFEIMGDIVKDTLEEAQKFIRENFISLDKTISWTIINVTE